MNSNYTWEDPLYLESHLTEDEKAIKYNTKKFCKERLLPIVIKDNQNHWVISPPRPMVDLFSNHVC